MKAVFFLALLSFQISSTAWAAEYERDLIGWSERRNPNVLRAEKAAKSKDAGQEKERGMVVLSWEPRIFLFRGLLTDEECDHLINKATPRFRRSGVVSEDANGSEISDIRTSDGMFFDRYEDDTIKNIEMKVSEWTLIPAGNGEGIQVLRYQEGKNGKLGGRYDPHRDIFYHEAGLDNGGNRLATVLMYLADVEAGGETVFPEVKAPESQTIANGYSECAMQGLAVKPRKGDAVAFWSLKTDGRIDSGSLHGSCPVIKGTKYAATKWYHVAHYAMSGEVAQRVEHIVYAPSPPPAPEWCKDTHGDCKGWAQSGECESNPGYMIGTKQSPGACLLSCGRCDLMAPDGEQVPGGKVGRKTLV